MGILTSNKDNSFVSTIIRTIQSNALCLPFELITYQRVDLSSCCRGNYISLISLTGDECVRADHPEIDDSHIISESVGSSIIITGE